ncbi:hypothetical protein BGZ90_011723 [Linnemannia elongata]|nr:hypothetical protein BGZ90_011723 [Linnemannia elongata]
MKYSDPITQVIIVGFICFCCPGMFNALNGAGSYGLEPKDSDVGNKASTALSCMFAFSSLFAGALFNIFGHRVLLILGGLTYTLYVASYLAYHYVQSLAFVVIASCLLGIGAGWLWTAQGAVMMGYPEEGEKGRFFSIFWTIFNCGGVIGCIIPLAIQWNDPKANGASTASYAAFMTLMTIGALGSVALLPTNKVFRKDGSPVVKVAYANPTGEFLAVIKLFADWRMLCLVPMFFSSNWFYTYQFNAVNAFNFSIRTRSMNSMFYWLAQIIGSILYGSFLDKKEWSRTTRARYGLFLLTAVLVATYAGGFVYQSKIGPKGWVIDAETGETVKDPASWVIHDLVLDTSAWIGPFFLYFMYGITDAMYQGFSYWVMGALTNDTNTAAKYAGFYKFVQNLGGILAPIVQTSTIGNGPSNGANARNATGQGMGELIVCVVLIFVGVLGAVPVVFKAIKDTTVEEGEVPTDKTEVAYDDVKA